MEEGRQGEEGAEGMAKDTHPPLFCSPSVEVAEDMAMVTFPPLSRWKKGGPTGAEGVEGMTNAEPLPPSNTDPRTSQNRT